MNIYGNEIITTVRNGYGRQVDSFETQLSIPDIGENIPAVFIRAPYIHSVGDQVNILGCFENRVVVAEEKNILVCAFHPELTIDTRVLAYFIRKI